MTTLVYKVVYQVEGNAASKFFDFFSGGAFGAKAGLICTIHLDKSQRLLYLFDEHRLSAESRSSCPVQGPQLGTVPGPARYESQ
jgi:hypothetical protein